MLEALIAELASIEDPRCGWKVEHRLLDILVIAVCAVLGEAETFEDIALYGRCQTTSGTRPRATPRTRPPPSRRRPGRNRCGAGLEQPRAALLAQPVAVAFDGQHVAVVEQTVEDRGRDHGVVQDRPPLAHAAVAGHQDAAPLVAAARSSCIMSSSVPVPSKVPPNRPAGPV